MMAMTATAQTIDTNQLSPYDQNASAPFLDPEWMFGVKDGFDIVIGNPPYIQLQANRGELANLYAGKGFATFERTGDIYCLFYERGFNLLAPGGHLCYITSNKWMRAGYGEATRRFFAERTRPQLLLDFAGEKIFESASVDTNIMLFANESPTQDGFPCCMATRECREDIARFVRENARAISFPQGEAWRILSASDEAILAKAKAVGKPLKDWGVQINYGIKTGFNEAFIIDGAKRNRLVAENPQSANILQPYVRGRDANRYSLAESGLWLIAAHNGYGGVSRVDVAKYPAVRKWLASFEPSLSNRSDQGDTPFNLRNCAYWGDFSKPKMLWAETMRIRRTSSERFPRFTYTEGGVIADKTCFFATGGNLKFITGVMNSMMGWYLCRHFVSILDNGGYMMQKAFVENIPIPPATPAEQAPIIALVERILAAKGADAAADTAAWEAEIDRLVYALYGLTGEEVAVVEGME